ncbi:MAG: phosphoribosylformylglycinamidine synthase subunit PurL [Candidatus Sumerlaeia bacterium]|nr:phosphoribosylformylglycinamidine synthase subunit PurL [Candidatus Sumerlaeia bacterium]
MIRNNEKATTGQGTRGILVTTRIEITPAIVEEHGLTPAEYAYLLEVLGREPTIAELGVFSVMWSEHCSYKHSRPHLATLPTKGPAVLHGPGENAGAVDLGEGWACVFKVESHNHPSAVEPYEGAATGVGGILRDIFAMGARPIALLDALRFGPPDEARNAWIIRGVVHGIADYGNCVGVPVIGGEFSIDPCYTDNCLVNVMAIGVARHEELMTARAEGVGNLLVYYGNATGRDGIHGATFASAELTEDSAEDRPCVQVGDPFMEKKILEATIELIASGRIVALQDMGAAGLTCSSTEMADKGGLGLRMNLDKVPQRAANLTAYELLLSESQERMLAVVRPEDLPLVARILRKWDLDACVVGETTDTGRFVVEHHGTVEANIPLPAICTHVPKPEPVQAAPAALDVRDWTTVDFAAIEWNGLLLAALSSPHFASKRWIYEQYDHQVQTNTVVRPGAGAGVLRIAGWSGLLASTIDGNGLWCMLDPYEGTRCVTAEAARNLVACGARPLAATNNLNFGSPRKPAGSWQFAEAVRGLGDACRALGTPITGGNVSFYNESPRMAVFPTPVVGMVGVIDDPSRLTPATFRNEGDVVVLLGPAATHAGGSRILRDLTGDLVGPAVRIDLAMEKRVQEHVLRLVGDGVLTAATDIADGGLLMALAEMALGSDGGLGCEIDLAADEAPAAALLSEQPSRFVVTCTPGDVESLLALSRDAGVRAVPLGTVRGGVFSIGGVLSLTVYELYEAWEKPL